MNSTIICNNNIIYPVGSIYTTPTNTNPAAYLPGEWTLIDKEFKTQHITYDANLSSNNISVANNRYIKVYNATGTTAPRIMVQRANHSIIIQFINMYPGAVKDSVNDNCLCDIHPAALGLNTADGVLSVYFSHFTDAGDAVFALSFAANSDKSLFKFYTTDILTTDTSDSNRVRHIDRTYSGMMTSCILPVLVTKPNCMLDEACNKFIWQRTA